MHHQTCLILQKKNCEGIKNINFKLTQVDNISSKNNTYDFVYGIRLLNQLAEKNIAQKGIREMIRVTKPGVTC